MGLQGGDAGPLFDDRKSVFAQAAFGGGETGGVHRGGVFDAAVFGQYGGYVGEKPGQYLGALAGQGSDRGDDMDHGVLLVG